MSTPRGPSRLPQGFTLLEASLGLGAAAILGLAALGLYRSSDATAKVRKEQANISALASAIESSLGLVGSFGSISVERVLLDRLAPPTLLQGNTLRNAWGGQVEVAPYAFSQPNDAFAVAYGRVPAKACVDLGSSLGSHVADLKVNGQSTLLDGGVDPGQLAARCADGGTMLFVFHTGLATGSAVAATSVTNPPPLVSPPSSPPTPPGTPAVPPGVPPVVVTPPLVVVQPAVAPPPGAPAYAPPPATPGVIPPMAPPPGPPTAPPGNSQTCQTLLASHPDVLSSRSTTPCATGQFGVIGEQQTQDWFCPDYYGNPSTGLTYEPWTSPTFAMTPWTQVSNTCAVCPAPQTDTTTQWLATSALCPQGQTGTHAWERAQSHSRSNTVQCGTPTPAGPTAGMTVSPWSTWSAWIDTGATRNEVNTCAPSCAGGMKWVDLGSSNRTGPAISPWFPQTPSGFGTATLHPALTPALLAAANAARSTATLTATPPPFDPVGIYYELLAGGTNTCSSPTDAGNVFYTRRYSRIPGIGAGMDGGGGVYESWHEGYMGCMSACDAPTYEPGVCRTANGPGVGSGFLHHYTEQQVVACPSPLTGNVTSERVGVCADSNSPVISWNAFYVKSSACSGTIYGRTTVPEPDMTSACGPNNPLPFRPVNSIYGGRCGAGNAGYFFFTSMSTQCVMCPPPMFQETGRYTVPSQTCSGATNYNRLQCSGFDQKFVDPNPFFNTWWIGHRNANCVCDDSNLGQRCKSTSRSDLAVNFMHG